MTIVGCNRDTKVYLVLRWTQTIVIGVFAGKTLSVRVWETARIRWIVPGCNSDIWIGGY